MKKITKAVIPVAGNGTRFLPFTKNVPKEMLPILNKPTIQYIVDEAVASGIEEIIFVISSSKTALANYFDRNLELERSLELKGNKEKMIDSIIKPTKQAQYVYIRQFVAKGLGHAVSLAANIIGDEPFALLLGDDVIYEENNNPPALKQLIETYEKTGKSVLGVQEVPKETVSNYGVISPTKQVDENSWEINKVVEKPDTSIAPSNLAIVGRYILDGSIFKHLLKNNIDKATGEIQITDSIDKLINEKGVVARNIIGRRYDMGSVKGFLEAQVEFALRDEEHKEYMQEIIDKNKQIKISNR